MSFFLVMFGFIAPNLMAQEQDTTFITLDDLKTPSSPAFVLMGIEPASIERPTTPKAVSASILSAYNSSDFLPESYAMEFSPYWLRSQPELGFEDYYANHGLAETFLQYLTFSIATTKSETVVDSSTTIINSSIGLGFRTRLVEGTVNSDLRNSYIIKKKEVQLAQIIPLITGTLDQGVNSYEELEEDLSNKIQYLTENLSLIVIANANDKEKINALKASKAAIQTIIEEQKSQGVVFDAETIIDTVDQTALDSEELRKLAKDVQGLSKERQGFIWEIAGAVNIDFTNQEYESGDLNKFGFWSTMTYRLDKPSVDGSLLTRILTEDKPGDDGVIFDIGGKLSYSYKDLNISGEFIHRSIITGKIEQNQDQTNGLSGSFSVENTTRFTGNFEYKINDGLYLTSSFGKDYERLGNPGGLIAQIGVNLGFGDLIKLN